MRKKRKRVFMSLDICLCFFFSLNVAAGEGVEMRGFKERIVSTTYI